MQFFFGVRAYVIAGVMGVKPTTHEFPPKKKHSFLVVGNGGFDKDFLGCVSVRVVAIFFGGGETKRTHTAGAMTMRTIIAVVVMRMRMVTWVL